MESSALPRLARSWFACVVLGMALGLAALTLYVLTLPAVAVAIALITWKGPRLVGAAGFLTGVGLVWTVLFARVALTCGGPLDSGANGTCSAGDLTGWIAASLTVFVVGLAGSASAFRRSRG